MKKLDYMIRTIKLLTVAMLCAAAASACSSEELANGGSDGSGSENGELGYVTFAENGISVEWSGEHVETSTGHEQLAKSPMRTRAGEEGTATDDFMVDIVRVNPDFEVLQTSRYGDIKNSLLALPLTRGGKECDYRIDVRSSDIPMADFAWEDEEGQPTYSGTSGEFRIGRSHNTETNPKQLDPIMCKLESVKISVSVETAMAELGSQIRLTAKIHEAGKDAESKRSLTFDEGDKHFGVVWLDDETREVLTELGDNGYEVQPAVGYLKPFDGDSDNRITLHVEMDYDNTFTGENLHISQDLKNICTGVHPNQYRRIFLYITHGEEEDLGKIIINASIETWTYDKEVTVNVVSSVVGGGRMSEDVIPDIDDKAKPRITLPSSWISLDDTNFFDAGNYDRLGNFNRSAELHVETGSAVTRFAVRVETGSASLASTLRGAGVYNTTVEMTDEPTTGQLFLHNRMGMPLKDEIGSNTSFKIDLKGFLDFLYFYGGEHKLIMGVTDSEGNYSRAELNIFYDSENGESTDPDPAPEIDWPDHDFNTRYTVSPEMDVKINIEAKSGIKSLMVKISGKIEAMLEEIPIPTEFDLVDPNEYGEELDSKLAALKFPVGDQVKDKTHLLFDISDFMVPLQETTEAGDDDFQLTVIDNKGKSATATIRLRVVK